MERGRESFVYIAHAKNRRDILSAYLPGLLPKNLKIPRIAKAVLDLRRRFLVMEINLPVVSVGRVGNRSRSPLSFCKASFGKRRCGRFQVFPCPFSFGGFTTELRIGGTQTPVPFTKNALLAWTFAKKKHCGEFNSAFFSVDAAAKVPS